MEIESTLKMETDLAIKGYLDIELDPELDLIAEINALKKEKMLSF